MSAETLELVLKEAKAHNLEVLVLLGISDFRNQILDVAFQVSGFRFPISDFRFQILDLRFQISDFAGSFPWGSGAGGSKALNLPGEPLGGRWGSPAGRVAVPAL